MTDINNRPNPREMTYAQAWEEYQNNGETWRTEHDEALQQVRLEMPEAGSGALVEAGLIMATRQLDNAKRHLADGTNFSKATNEQMLWMAIHLDIQNQSNEYMKAETLSNEEV